MGGPDMAPPTPQRSALSAAAAGWRLSLHQLEARVVGALHERDARALGVLDRPLEQRGAQPLESRDVGLDALRVEAEVLEAVVRVGVAGAEPLVRARARDVDREAVLAGAAHEAVTEHARLVVGDLEAEPGDVPLGGLARVRRL